MRAYRLACYLAEVSWPDALKVAAHPLTRDIASQIVRALGSVRADLVEGYSRSGGRDRARYFEYALGSAREAREWYGQVRPVLGDEVSSARHDRCAEIVRLLMAAIPRERHRTIRPAREETEQRADQPDPRQPRRGARRSRPR